MADIKTAIQLELEDLVSKGLLDLIKEIEKLQSKFKDLTKAGKAVSNATETMSNANIDAKKSQKDLASAVNNTNSNLREQISNLAGAAAGFYAAFQSSKLLTKSLSTAANRQVQLFELSTVVKGGNTKGLEEFINKTASSGLDSYNNLVETAYSLLSAGISEEETKAGTEIASRVAAITKGHASEIANVMATASKDFRISMAETGDVLAKAQNIFQIKDFAQLEEGIKYVAASASSLNVPLDQTAALLGVLNDAGQAGSMAGTGVANIFASLPKAVEALGVAIPKAKDGSLDLVEFIEQVQTKLNKAFGNDNLAKQAVLIKIFGQEGARSFLTLSNRSKELEESYSKLKNESKGFVNQTSNQYLELYNTKLKGLINSFGTLAASLGNLLLPVMTEFFSIANKMIIALSELINKHNSVGYAILALSGIITSVFVGFAAMKLIAAVKEAATVFLLFGRAISFVTVATRVLTAAMASNPLGFIAFALALAASQIILHWDKVKKWFNGFFTWLANNPMLKFLKSIGKFTAGLFKGGSSKEAVSATNNIKLEKTPNLVKEQVKNSSNTVNNTNHHINVTINSSSSDPKAIANQVNAELAKKQQLLMVGN